MGVDQPLKAGNYSEIIYEGGIIGLEISGSRAPCLCISRDGLSLKTMVLMSVLVEVFSAHLLMELYFSVSCDFCVCMMFVKKDYSPFPIYSLRL